MRRFRFALFLIVPLGLLAGCDQLGIETATAVAAKRDAEGRAVGGACRHAARAIEQCYAQNKRADKAAVFAGWREMNDYMRENKIDAMPGAADPSLAAGAGEAADDEHAEKGSDKGSDKGGDKAADKTSDKRVAKVATGTPKKGS
jgi:hypothetical protein